MTKCYIIEQGDYSDYRVVGIFSTRVNAEQALAYLNLDSSNTFDPPSIEERELDPAIAQLNEGLFQYIVHFDQRTNSTTVRPRIDLCKDNEAHWDWGSYYIVWATDDQHAIKIAAERNAQYLATKAGIA